MDKSTRLVENMFEITVTSAGETVEDSFTVPSIFKTIEDMLLTSNRKDLLAFRGKFRMNIGDQEIFTKNYRAELVMPGFHVSPNEKWRKLLQVADLEKSGDEIEFSYTDDQNGTGNFAPYVVYLYVRGQRK